MSKLKPCVTLGSLLNGTPGVNTTCLNLLTTHSFQGVRMLIIDSELCNPDTSFGCYSIIECLLTSISMAHAIIMTMPVPSYSFKIFSYS